MAENTGVVTRAKLKPGDVIEYETIRSTLLELNEESFRSRVEVTGEAGGGPLHRHMHQSEHFAVEQGALRVRTGLRGSRLVSAGEEILIPAATPHTFSVESDSATFVASFSPADRLPEYFRDLFDLGEPGIRDLARLAKEYPREHFYLPIVPPVIQRLLLRPFA